MTSRRTQAPRSSLNFCKAGLEAVAFALKRRLGRNAGSGAIAEIDPADRGRYGPVRSDAGLLRGAGLPHRERARGPAGTGARVCGRVRSDHSRRDAAGAGRLRSAAPDSQAQRHPRDHADGAHRGSGSRSGIERRRRRLPAQAVRTRRTAGEDSGGVAARAENGRCAAHDRGGRREDEPAKQASVAVGRTAGAYRAGVRHSRNPGARRRADCVARRINRRRASTAVHALRALARRPYQPLAQKAGAGKSGSDPDRARRGIPVRGGRGGEA